MIIGKKEIQRYIIDPFELKVLDAAFRNLEDKTNPLCFNNFAYVLRELVYMVIDQLAPNKDVIKARWWIPSQDDKIANRANRKQQIRYALLDGNPESFVYNILEIDVDEMADYINDCLVNLNKYTHISKSYFGCSDEELPKRVSEACSIITNILGTIEQTREKIAEGIIDSIDDELLETMYMETFDNIDILSTHSTIENYSIEHYDIQKKSEDRLICVTEGTVNVRLQYGSDGDQRRGDGMVTTMEFPFSAEFSCRLYDDGISDYEVFVNSIEIDADSFYE